MVSRFRYSFSHERTGAKSYASHTFVEAVLVTVSASYVWHWLGAVGSHDCKSWTHSKPFRHIEDARKEAERLSAETFGNTHEFLTNGVGNNDHLFDVRIYELVEVVACKCERQR